MVQTAFQKIFAGFSTLCVFLSFNSQVEAQILTNQPAKVWIKPYDTPGNTDTSFYVGNYPVLNLNDSLTKHQLNRIALAKSGTIFLVIKVDPDSVAEPFVKTKNFSLYKEQAVIQGSKLVIPPVVKNAVIVRFFYQAYFGRRRNWPSKLSISSGVKLSEVIYYDEVLNREQSRIVYSYLAMKYSINITENENPKLRDYLNVFNSKVWDSKADKPFNEQVMALGRLDRIDFYQSQTFTADNQNIQLSLSQTGTLGDMPGISMSDSSLLIFSKDNEQNYIVDCGGTSIKPWKIKLRNWHSSAPYLYITLDTLLGSLSSPALTNGIDWEPLDVVVSGTKTIITVPLPDTLANIDYYVAWDNSIYGCDPLSLVQFPNCSGANGSTDPLGDLQIVIKSEALPADVSLINLNSGESLNSTIHTTGSIIKHLPTGASYHLIIKNQEKKLTDTIYTIDSCPSGSSEVDSGGFVLESANLTRDITGTKIISNSNEGGVPYSDSFERGIGVYPNPSSNNTDITFFFNRLNDENFTIDLLDDKGRLLDHIKFTPRPDHSTLQYKIQIKGVYNLRFTSDNYKETKQLIIN